MCHKSCRKASPFQNSCPTPQVNSKSRRYLWVGNWKSIWINNRKWTEEFSRLYTCFKTRTFLCLGLQLESHLGQGALGFLFRNFPMEGNQHLLATPAYFFKLFCGFPRKTDLIPGDKNLTFQACLFLGATHHVLKMGSLWVPWWTLPVFTSWGKASNEALQLGNALSNENCTLQSPGGFASIAWVQTPGHRLLAKLRAVTNTEPWKTLASVNATGTGVIAGTFETGATWRRLTHLIRDLKNLHT